MSNTLSRLMGRESIASRVYDLTCILSFFSLPYFNFILSVDEASREEIAPGTDDASTEPSTALPPSVVISSATPVGKPVSKLPSQSSSHAPFKQSARVPSTNSSHRQSPTQEAESAVPPKEKPADVKPNASIFLQTANFLLEMNALQVK